MFNGDLKNLLSLIEPLCQYGIRLAYMKVKNNEAVDTYSRG